MNMQLRALRPAAAIALLAALVTPAAWAADAKAEPVFGVQRLYLKDLRIE